MSLRITDGNLAIHCCEIQREGANFYYQIASPLNPS
jgi:hypothetical protein